MIPKINKFFGTALIASVFVVLGISAQAAVTNAAPKEAAAKVPTPPPEPAISVFDQKLKGGKDPFFPGSARLVVKEVIPGQKQVAAPVDPTKDLSLKGITGSKGRRLALINNQLFETGEQATVRVPTGQIKVRCVEIRDHSVIITVDGGSDTKELRLKDF